MRCGFGRTKRPLAARGYQQQRLSFRGDAQHRTTMCNCTLENLELIYTDGKHSRFSGAQLRTIVRRFAPPRNDGDYLPPAAAMISCSIATWRAKAPRPAAVAVTVVCGFLPTKAFSTPT